MASGGVRLCRAVIRSASFSDVLMYGWLLGAILTVGLAGGIALKVQTVRLHNAQESARIAKANVETLKESIKLNSQALKQCQAVNRANALIVDQQTERANQAIKKVESLRVKADRELASIEAQANDNRETQSDSRRTLVDPLPADLVSWMPRQSNTGTH